MGFCLYVLFIFEHMTNDINFILRIFFCYPPYFTGPDGLTHDNFHCQNFTGIIISEIIMLVVRSQLYVNVGDQYLV